MAIMSLGSVFTNAGSVHRDVTPEEELFVQGLEGLMNLDKKVHVDLS